MTARYPGNSAFIEAAQYTHAAGSNGTVTRVVIHDMEWPEKPDTAEACAQMFHTTTAEKSAHFCVDNNSVVQCVDIDKRAWHAPPNAGSVGIEHAGYARQSTGEWLDAYGKAMIEVSARLTAWLCKTLSIPARWLTVNQLRNGERGICTHADVSNAFHQSDHTDPGPNFPKDYFLSRVQSYMNGVSGSVTPDEIETVAQATFAKIFNYVIPGSGINFQTMVKRTYDALNRLEPLVAAINDAEEREANQGVVDVGALATALAGLLPTTLNVDPTLLARAVSDEIHNRMSS